MRCKTRIVLGGGGGQEEGEVQVRDALPGRGEGEQRDHGDQAPDCCCSGCVVVGVRGPAADSCCC